MKASLTYIIIAYNEETTILNCIDSILNQKNSNNAQILVVNDASTDKTADIVKSIANQNSNIKLINNKSNRGRGFSRKIGIDNSNSSLIAFIDADIILPKNWLTKCVKLINNYDVVGGIALPDGDVQYIYSKFNLEPLIKEHTVEVTGNNGLYKRKIFSAVNFEESMENGEDVDFIWRLKEHSFKVFSISDLICQHRENKSFLTSVHWLYESGIGASLLLKKFMKIRLPDIVFSLFTINVLAMIVVLILNLPYILLLLTPLFLLIVSYFHIASKFKLELTTNSFLAVITNVVFILSYLVGRFIGLFKTNE